MLSVSGTRKVHCNYSSRKVFTGFIDAAANTLYPITHVEMINIMDMETIKVSEVVD